MTAPARAALLVESDPIVALEVEACLLEAGYGQIVHRQTLEEAMADLTDVRFDLAVVSVGYALGGACALVEACRAVRCFCILLTSSSPGETRTLSWPGVRILHKPFNSSTLAQLARAAPEARSVST